MTVLTTDGQRQQLVPKLLALFAQRFDLGLCHLALVDILGRFSHLLAAADLVGQSLEFAILGGDLGQPTVLARRGTHQRPVAEHLGVRHVTFKLMESRQLFFQRIAYRSTHEGCLYRGGCRRIRPGSVHKKSRDGPMAIRPRGCDARIRYGSYFFLPFLWRKAAVGSGSKLLLELVDPASRVDVFQLPGVKGMTFIANVDLQLGADTSSRERVATTTANGGFLVIGVDAVFHGVRSVFLGVRKEVLALGTAPGNPEMYATGMLLFKGSRSQSFSAGHV